MYFEANLYLSSMQAQIICSVLQFLRCLKSKASDREREGIRWRGMGWGVFISLGGLYLWMCEELRCAA